jgi:hypothetical protein
VTTSIKLVKPALVTTSIKLVKPALVTTSIKLQCICEINPHVYRMDMIFSNIPWPGMIPFQTRGVWFAK